MTSALLEVEGIHRHFGGVRAVNGVSLRIDEGGVFGLIGPNGAGKTTLVNVITGYSRLDQGSVRLGAIELGGKTPDAIARLGVGRTFQTIRLYRDLTAIENVLVGMHPRRKHDTLAQLALLPVLRRGQKERVDEARELLTQVGLDPADCGDRRAATLSYGDQRRLEVARALALRPRLLILDEPAAGMNPSEKERIRNLIKTVSGAGLTVLLIDHDMRLVMGVCDHIAVLNFGQKIADGTPAEVAANPDVISAYLGSRAADAAGADRAPGAGGTGTGATPAAPLAVATAAEGAGVAPLLRVSELHVSYGAVRAIHGVSFTVARGEVVALIGANGAGKSTILNTLSGLLRPTQGEAVFDGLDLATAGSQQVVRHGLVQVPEGREVLARLTVEENLALGGWGQRGQSVREGVQSMMERFPILAQRRSLPAGQLSGGEQQVLAIARGLVARPRLLLLDEPSLGLAPQMVDRIFDIILEIRTEGTTILLVEQNALRALEIADRGYVVETGQILLSGTGAELLRNAEVRKAYLGG
ncbi:MAG: ATP-binding cassette domain-containing protein [Candidatus Dormibacteria bacterium]